MNRHVYNIAIAAGILLTSVGAGLWDIGAGLVTAGVLILGFTVYAVRLLSRGEH
jgi:hypothetical protein